MVGNKRVAYISGGITGVKNYREIFDQAEKELKELGYIVINPAKIEDCLPPVFSWDEYMTLCYPMIDLSDDIFFLDNWEDSKGALCEYNFGEAQGKGLYTLSKYLSLHQKSNNNT